MVIAYCVLATATFILVMSAFLKDTSVSNTDPMAWIFILTATLLSPMTLPFILRAKLQARQASSQLKPSEASKASEEVEVTKPQFCDLPARK